MKPPRRTPACYPKHSHRPRQACRTTLESCWWWVVRFSASSAVSRTKRRSVCVVTAEGGGGHARGRLLDDGEASSRRTRSGGWASRTPSIFHMERGSSKKCSVGHMALPVDRRRRTDNHACGEDLANDRVNGHNGHNWPQRLHARRVPCCGSWSARGAWGRGQGSRALHRRLASRNCRSSSPAVDRERLADATDGCGSMPWQLKDASSCRATRVDPACHVPSTESLRR